MSCSILGINGIPASVVSLCMTVRTVFLDLVPALQGPGLEKHPGVPSIRNADILSLLINPLTYQRKLLQAPDDSQELIDISR